MEKGSQIHLSDLISKSSIIYRYLAQARDAMTYMSIEPQQTLVEKNLIGLGFDLQRAGKKDCSFNIRQMQKDPQKLLMLSYYSMQLFPMLFMEGCFSLYV
jgi:hypothetical protein